MTGRTAVVALGCVLSVGILFARDAPTSGRSRLQGRIVRADGKSPAEGAIVTAIHLDSGKTFPAAPASRGGGYELEGLPYGYYGLAIDAGGTLFSVVRPVNLAPSHRLTLDIALSDVPQPSEGADGLEEGVLVPVLNRRAMARAVPVGDDKPPFMRSRTGYIAAIGGALLLFLLLQ